MLSILQVNAVSHIHLIGCCLLTAFESRVASTWSILRAPWVLVGAAALSKSVARADQIAHQEL